MENIRLSKIERLLQKEMGDIFQKQTQAAAQGAMLSVTRVRVSADLSVARVYLSIFPSDKSEILLKAVRANARTLRYDLGQRVRMQLRKIPELTFFIDDTLDYLENIDKLLNT